MNCNPCAGIVYNDSCLSKCPDITIYDTNIKTCRNCKDSNEYLHDGKCKDKCPSGYTGRENICVTCKENKQFDNDGKCVDKCPSSCLNSDGICINSIIQYNLSKRMH
jgi:hypothetical protein